MLYLAVLWLHVLGTFFLVGQALSFSVLALSRARGSAAGADEVARFAQSPWPPRGLAPRSLPLGSLGLAAFAFLAVSGAALPLVAGRPLDSLWSGPLLAATPLGKLALSAVLVLCQSRLVERPTALASHLTLAAALAVVGVSLVDAPVELFDVCLVLHVLAASLWIGHMLFWSVVVGPVLKRWSPEDERERLRAAVMRFGGLGWPALFVLLATGPVLLRERGFALESLANGEVFDTAWGRLLALKLLLVLGMLGYQALVGHRPAPKLVYLNLLAAFAIAALSLALSNPGAWAA